LVARFHEYRKTEVDTLIHKELNPTGEKLTMGEVIHQLNLLTNGDAVNRNRRGSTPDGSMSLRQDLNHSKSNVTSGGLGTMGFATSCSNRG
jgi:acetolactate synthase-1/2/3 large subunit